MSYLRDEIIEQPQVFERLLAESRDQVHAAARVIAERAPKFVVFAARGSSDNAATYARYLMEMYCRLPVSSAAPSIYGLYQRPPRLGNSLVIGISQSGQSPDVVSVLTEAQRQGALTLAITNEQSSPLAQAADVVIEQRAGQEHSVAATKTYTTQLLALALLAAELSQDTELVDGIERLPAGIRLALDLEDDAESMAQDLARYPACLVMARGFNSATAFELALKFKELAYLFAEPYSTADFLHGPMALAERGLPAILVGIRGPAQPGLLDLAQHLVEAGVRLFPISDEPSLLARGAAGHTLSLIAALEGIPEALSPLVSIVPGQFLAMYLAAYRRGGDLDQPRGLSKITRTD